MNKNKNLFLAIATGAAVTFGALVGYSNVLNVNNTLPAKATTESLEGGDLDVSSNTYVDSYSYTTDDGYSTFVFTKIKSYNDGLCELDTNGTITKEQASNGLTSVTIDFSYDNTAGLTTDYAAEAAILIETSFTKGGQTTTYNVYDDVTTDICGNYFTIKTNVKVYINSITFDYDCVTPSLGHSLSHVDATSTTLEHYACNACNTLFSDAHASEEIDAFQYFVTPISESTQTSVATVAKGTLNDKDATAITIKGGAQVGNKSNFVPKNDKTPNERVPFFKERDTALVMYFKNTSSTETVSFRYFFDLNGDKGGLEVDSLLPGETRRVEGNINWAVTTPGGWNGITLKSDVTKDVEILTYGYVDTHNEYNGVASKLEQVTPANKLTFKVGETFNHDGLTTRINSEKFDGVNHTNVDNFVTNLDGHIFTAEDIGTQTVTVSFAATKFTYTITVYDAHDCSEHLEYTPASTATNFADGTLGYYTCSEDGKVYEDENATTPTTVDARKQASKQWTLITPAKDNGNWWIKYGIETIDEDPIFNAGPVGAGRFRFGKDNDESASAGFSWKFVRTSDGEINAPNFNPHLPSKLGATISVKWVVINKGTTDFKIKLKLDEFQAESEIIAEALAGQTNIIEHTYVDSTDTDGWMYGVLDCTVNKYTDVYMYGYVSMDEAIDIDGTTNTLTKLTSANKLTFSVGETFSYDGLSAKATINGNSSGNNKPYIYKFTTNFDGHTFTAEDAGTHTVHARFGSDEITYEIEVLAEHNCADNLKYVAPQAATNFANGTLGYYTCSIDGNTFEDAEGTIPTTVADRVDNSAKSKQWTLITPSKTNGAWWINYSIETIDEDPIFGAGPVGAGRFRFGKDNDESASAGFDWKFVRTVDGEINAPYFNPHLPSKQGATISVKWVVINKGTTDFKIKLKLDEHQAESEIIAEALAGQTNIIEHTYVDSTASDGWMFGVLDCTVNKYTDVYMYGYVSMDEAIDIDGTTNTLTKLTSAEKLTFSVGETFSYDGLSAKATINGNSSGQDKPYIYKFTTNFDGHTFTADDIGTHTVYARFGGAVISYQITVA